MDCQVINRERKDTNGPRVLHHLPSEKLGDDSPIEEDINNDDQTDKSANSFEFGNF